MEEYGVLQVDHVCAEMDFSGMVVSVSHVQVARYGTTIPIDVHAPTEPTGMDLFALPALLA